MTSQTAKIRIMVPEIGKRLTRAYKHVLTTSHRDGLMRTTNSTKPLKSGLSAITIFLMVVSGVGGDPCRGAPGDASGLVLNADTPWVVAEEQPEAVARALQDVESDWYKVFGHRPVVLREPPSSWKGPVIYLGVKGAWRESLLKEPSAGAESFVLRVHRDAAGRPALVAAGMDMRGSIYAAYALSEEILGVDPWYYWVDKEPVARQRIEVPAGLEKRFGPPTFKYRGWFINDEDLLGGFAPDPLRENVFSLEMYDHIYETLLRLRGNMIVPATFPFPDERCQELAARRGLVLNMHHILVVGLNTYRWPKDVPFSYSKHPDIMERYWQTCIQAFKGREVVWTVGYRGKHDRPFWADEPELKTPELRGAVVTRAIAKQVELIRKADPLAMIIANLWMEGAELIQAGHLTLPEGVVQVWPDDGSGIIRDNGTVKAGQGIYYHTAMLNGHANQLSEMVNPGRIYGELGRFARAGATNFFLVNVSDVRPVPLSTDLRDAICLECRTPVGQARLREHGRLSGRLEPAAVRATPGGGGSGDLRRLLQHPLSMPRTAPGRKRSSHPFAGAGHADCSVDRGGQAAQQQRCAVERRKWSSSPAITGPMWPSCSARRRPWRRAFRLIGGCSIRPTW